jgi:hypothetical protein
MVTQGHAPLSSLKLKSTRKPIQASADEISTFRNASAFYLQSVRQGVNQLEYFLGKIAKSSDSRVVESIPGGTGLVATMRADLLHFEDKWNQFNASLEPAEVT